MLPAKGLSGEEISIENIRLSVLYVSKSNLITMIPKNKINLKINPNAMTVKIHI